MSMMRRGMSAMIAGLAIAAGLGGGALAQTPVPIQAVPAASKKRKKQLFTGRVIYEGERYKKRAYGSVARDKRAARKAKNRARSKKLG